MLTAEQKNYPILGFDKNTLLKPGPYLIKIVTIIQDDNVIELTIHGDEVKQPPTQQVSQQTTPKPVTKLPPKKPDTTISALADKQLLRDFINGDYCLHGVG